MNNKRLGVILTVLKAGSFISPELIPTKETRNSLHLTQPENVLFRKK